MNPLYNTDDNEFEQVKKFLNSWGVGPEHKKNIGLNFQAANKMLNEARLKFSNGFEKFLDEDVHECNKEYYLEEKDWDALKERWIGFSTSDWP